MSASNREAIVVLVRGLAFFVLFAGAFASLWIASNVLGFFISLAVAIGIIIFANELDAYLKERETD